MNATRRWLVAVCVVFAASGGAVAASVSAAGGPGPARFALSVSVHRIRYRGRPVLLAVTMRTGKATETVALGLSESGWPDPHVFGSPLLAGPPRLLGAGRITGEFAAGGASRPGPVFCFAAPIPMTAGSLSACPRTR